MAIAAYGRYIEKKTLAVPNIIRSSPAYKRKLFKIFDAQFNALDTPQIFGTITCNLNKPRYQEVYQHFRQDGDTIMSDSVLIVLVFQDELDDVFNKFIRGAWGRKYLGGIRAFCHVIEFQGRGVPHAHFASGRPSPLTR